MWCRERWPFFPIHSYLLSSLSLDCTSGKGRDKREEWIGGRVRNWRVKWCDERPAIPSLIHSLSWLISVLLPSLPYDQEVGNDWREWRLGISSFLIPSSLFLFFFFLSLLIPFVTIFRDFRSLNEVVHQREVQPWVGGQMPWRWEWNGSEMRFLPSLSLVLSIGLYLTFLFLFLHHSEERTDERGKGDEMIAGEPMGRIAFFLLSVLCFQELEMGRERTGREMGEMVVKESPISISISPSLTAIPS